MIAESDLERITGTAFIFNANREPALGEVTALDLLPGEQKPGTHLVFPWLSNTSQFSSVLIVNNLADDPAQISLTARRKVGEPQEVQVSIPANGFLKAAIEDLFPSLGTEGGGIAIELTSDHKKLHGRWVTLNLLAGSGASPSQGVAIDLDPNSAGYEDRVELDLFYGVLFGSQGLQSGPVLLNVGQATADATLRFYDAAGNLVLEDSQTGKGLEPFRPVAFISNALLGGNQDVYMEVTCSQPITGVTFAFNDFGEPALGVVKARRANQLNP